jgi:2-succinyl-5-enolpyruvyl-6-hydroxy-3-cyclohexene-1-carboxylate synthase
MAMADQPTGCRSGVEAALELLAALQDGGLSHVIVCPGSRSAPLAVAAGLLEGPGLRLHTAFDERSAAFFALGLGRALGLPAAVITTSGSAVAHLLPAAVEADTGTVPLLLLTADRPDRLKGCGANQSVNQEEFLRASCRWLGQGDGRGLARMAAADLAQLAARALEHCLGDGGRVPPGPVHLNLPFEEPLHLAGPELVTLAAGAHERVLGAAPETSAGVSGSPLPLPQAARLDPDRPGVVVAGPWRGRPQSWRAHIEALRAWEGRSGWPVLADALSGLRGQPGLDLVAGYDLILEQPPHGLGAAQVLRLGSLPASRRLQAWLEGIAGPQVLVSEGDPRRLDPLGRARAQWSGGLAAWWKAQALPPGRPAPESLAYARRWQAAEDRVKTLLDGSEALLQGEPFEEPFLARRLARLLPPGLPVMLANSSPVRDWESFVPADVPPRPVFSFRGASGIDGTLSIAAGLAEALGQLVLITGDLALLHDANGWLWLPRLAGRLTVLVIANGGGGIFEQLPIRTDPPSALDFERLFAMPQAVSPLALAAVHGVEACRVVGPADLEAQLVWALGRSCSLLELPSDRQADAGLRQRLRTMAARLSVLS